MSARYTGGIVTKNPQPLNPAAGNAANGVFTMDQYMQAVQNGTWPAYDPYFEYNTLLLHGNGTNGAQNNTFLDSSTNNFTITRNGNTTQGSFSPFSNPPNEWSAAWSSANLSATVAAINPGTVPISLEFWLNWTGFISGAASGNTVYVWTVGSKNSYGSVMQVTISGGNITFAWGQPGNGAPVITKSTPIVVGEWHHYLWIRNGATATLYVDGVSVGNGVGANGWSASSTAMEGTQYFNEPATNFLFAGGFQGYISNFRLITNQAIVSGNFTPSTNGLTATSIGHTGPNVAASITGTVQELFFSTNAAWKDQSSNNRTPSSVASVTTSAFSPFEVATAYDPAVNGGSGYFDGSGDTLTSATVGTTIGTGDWCLECWVYQTASAGISTLVELRTSSTYHIYLQTNAGVARFVNFQNPGSDFNISGGVVLLNSWTHLVGTFQSGTVRLFVNGVLVASQGSLTRNYGTAGVILNPPAVSSYISDSRITIGSVPTSYQTSSTTNGTVVFTPPAAPLTTTSQGATSGDVDLLLNYTNAGIFDNTGFNNLETAGNAQIDTTVKKFGSGAMEFDGSGDWITSFSPGGNFALGAIYTIELWFYTNTIAATNGGIINLATTVSGNAGLNIYRATAEILCNNGATAGTGPSSGVGSVLANTWTHLAVTSDGTFTRIFLDGVLRNTFTRTTGSVNFNTYMTIGSFNDKTAPFNGYIDDLRITKGIARYTANFTPQTSQWQDQ